ncbi:glycosyltransferase 8 domain-containing protein 1-like isoform X2 [Littorina saxatilis]|uniref:glycosyltransferase 8 domain-containing protein 1-like isoform X2 n=1 Tax=Littorina saxatilis TaxID=31220 RepID=UPI0038B65BD6
MARICGMFRQPSTTAFCVVAATLILIIIVYTADLSTFVRQVTHSKKIIVDPCAKGQKETVVHVVVVGNDRLWEGMLTLATSIVINTRSDVMFHFVTLTPQASQLKAAIEASALRSVRYEVIPFSEDRVKGQYIVKSPRKDLDHPLNFGRFFMPELLPDVCRVIYIDADCLVLGDISELHNLTLKNNDVMAALNEKKPAHLGVNFSNPYVKARGIPRDTDIINNGIFVADLQRWRQQNITARLLYWMRLNVVSSVLKWGDCGSGSQGLMLLTVFDKYTPLPKEWNALQGHHGKELGNKKLLHWNGSDKPWHTKHTTYSITLWRKYNSFLHNSAHLIIPGARVL